jgi:hypothetical protein
MLAAIDNVHFETTKGDRSAFTIYLVPSAVDQFRKLTTGYWESYLLG